jgi:hypothetical protein
MNRPRDHIRCLSAMPQIPEITVRFMSSRPRAEQRVSAEYGRKRDGLRKHLDEVHTGETTELKSIQEYARRRDALAKEVRAKETEFRRTAADSQLHRVAVDTRGLVSVGRVHIGIAVTIVS